MIRDGYISFWIRPMLILLNGKPDRSVSFKEIIIKKGMNKIRKIDLLLNEIAKSFKTSVIIFFIIHIALDVALTEDTAQAGRQTLSLPDAG